MDISPQCCIIAGDYYKFRTVSNAFRKADEIDIEKTSSELAEKPQGDGGQGEVDVLYEQARSFSVEEFDAYESWLRDQQNAERLERFAKDREIFIQEVKHNTD